jgi:hypothetical protein
MPKFPGLEEMLSTAQKMYDFVNAGSKRWSLYLLRLRAN